MHIHAQKVVVVIVKWIGSSSGSDPKFESLKFITNFITNSVTSSITNFVPCCHYPRAIWQSGYYLGEAGIIQEWVWTKFRKVGTIWAKLALSTKHEFYHKFCPPCCHYPIWQFGKVGTIWAKLALSKNGFGPNLVKWALSWASCHCPKEEFV